jgi:hypothetical protein
LNDFILKLHAIESHLEDPRLEWTSVVACARISVIFRSIFRDPRLKDVWVKDAQENITRFTQLGW